MYYGERLNSFTHLAGTVLAAIGAPLLVVLAARSGDAWKIVGCSTYGAALFLLYGASTLYHSARGRAKASCASSITARSTCSSPAPIRRSRW